MSNRSRRPGRARYSADRRSVGIGVLAVVGVIGIVLGAHGWSVRNSGTVGGNFSAVGGSSSSSSTTSTTSPPSNGTPSSTTQPQSTTSTSTPSGSSSNSSGPTLASAGYTPYAYEIYPARETASTKLALAGFKYVIHTQGAGIALKLTVAGSGQTAAQKSYPSTDKIYFIDTTLGDDSGDADYSYGDDGLIATNASGHIVQ